MPPQHEFERYLARQQIAVSVRCHGPRPECCGLEAVRFKILTKEIALHVACWEQEECLFDDIYSGTKVSGSFQVSSGGFLDIDAKVLSPNIPLSQPTSRLNCIV